MSIPGQQTINVGLPNESANSDSLYTAFTKTQQNFSNLFACSSPYNTFTAGAGITASANATTGTVTITNTGVTSIVAGSNIVINQSNGAVTISSTGGGGGGGLSSVGVAPVSNTRLVVTNSPLVINGNIAIDLATSGVTGGTYNNPTITVDTYGRITSAANGSIAGTVTSVGLTAGPGIQINGGPITTNGNILVTNTGVTRINPGAGIVVSSGNGSVTISAASLGGTVTSVGVSSSQLVVTGSPVVTTGTIAVNLPDSATFSGNVTAGGIKTNNLYYANGTPWDLQEAAGTNNQIQFNSGNNFSASANLTFDPSARLLTVTGNIIGGNIYANSGTIGATLFSGTLSTAAQPNITSVGTLANLSVTGNTTVGNLVIPSGNIIYTPRYGSFYSNTTQTNPVANTAMAMTFNNTPSANGVSIVSNSQLTVAKAGVYNIQFSAQCTKTDAGTDYLEIWLSKNGSSVPWTNTRIKLDGSNAYEVAAWNFVETLNAGEYVQVMWGSADLNAQIVAIPSANTIMGIDVPSVIVTVTPVGA
jgi:hypothetical protein